jgi:hypothetical protein
LIYISEAHAEDEWPLSKHWKICQHKTIEERIDAAKMLIDQNKLTPPVFVDALGGNNFETHYAAWPERGYVVSKNKITLICDGVANGIVNWHSTVHFWLQSNVGPYFGKDIWNLHRKYQ